MDISEINDNVKTIFKSNIDSKLESIQKILTDIDKGKFNNENLLKKYILKIETKIEEIRKICDNSEEKNNEFNKKYHDVEAQMNKIKYLERQYNTECKKINDTYIKKRNEMNNNSNNNKKNINNNNIINDRNDKIINQNDKIPLQESFLFKIKDKKNIMDFYKTSNLFSISENDEIDNVDECTIIERNWHEICYVYDDYDIHDVYYDIIAIGLLDNHYFNSTSFSFYNNTIFDIQSFSINGVQTKFEIKKYSIHFNIHLENLDKAHIHIIYKESPDLKMLTKGEQDQRKIYRQNHYGIHKSLAGQMAKFILIVRGNFDIVNFDKYFLIRNTKNKKEIEYIWGGRVPQDGQRTLITFSRNQAIWSFYFSATLESDNEIKDTTYYSPVKIIGGNNEIININYSSPQSKNIKFDDENKEFIVKFENTNSKKVEIIIKGKLRNKCKGEWHVDLSDEEIEKRIPKKDAENKEALRKIAKKIINEFDKENKNSDFEFLDYMKIGLWVYKNIKYDYQYSGKTHYSAIEIYKMRAGVCHHFTVLSNALLYALGYKVIYISGYACKKSKLFQKDSGHAWSLIKLGNKWYPFDSTWGIVLGKLHVGHIFESFFNINSRTYGSDSIEFGETECKGKYIS